MMKKLASLIFFIPAFILSNVCAYPQSNGLYMPLEFQKAYKNETRNFDGTPGVNYWQNRSDYKIKAELVPSNRMIEGEETVYYTNNSPDTLTEIYIRLYQDLFKLGGLRDWAFNPADIHDGVELKSIKVNDEEISQSGEDSKIRRSSTLFEIKLTNPIPPKSKSKIDIAWSFKLSRVSNVRTGTYDSTSFFVAYWFPQVSVYDDIAGWDKSEFTGTQEFYNDFGSFDVDITVPKGFLIWATGLLQNAKEVLSEKIYRRYSEALKSDKIISIVKAEDYNEGIVTVRKEKLTWKFKADYVPDFAFASSGHYLWDGSSLVVDEKSGRKVFVDAAYNQESKDFYEVAEIGRNTVKLLSSEMPGYPFPYPKITVFNGSGGMEYPMMVNDGSASTRNGTVHVTSHEITHSYFPFFMGTNEKKYAWMDEGWATMLPYGIQSKLAQGYDPISRNITAYESFAGSELDLPMMVSSVQLRNASYRNASYHRPAAAYEILKDLLGSNLFKKAMHEYIIRWNGKHPSPYDFFFTFNNVADQNLDWFWKPWFFESGYPDLSIKNVSLNESNLEVAISKKGNIPVPVSLTLTFGDSSQISMYESAAVWKEGRNEKLYKFTVTKSILNIELGSSHIPDVNSSDNFYAFELKKD